MIELTPQSFVLVLLGLAFGLLIGLEKARGSRCEVYGQIITQAPASTR